jgi:curved DNA-binding protein CbpA
MDSRKDYYGVLGISKTEAYPGIHSAYRRLAKDCHPDRAGDQGTQKFQEIQEAYEVLSDPEKRSRYDEHATPVGRRQCPRAEPLVRPRTTRFNEPEPLIPSDSATEYLDLAFISVCRSCGTPRIDGHSACPFCCTKISREEALSHLMAQYLYMARRAWF